MSRVVLLPTLLIVLAICCPSIMAKSIATLSTAASTTSNSIMQLLTAPNTIWTLEVDGVDYPASVSRDPSSPSTIVTEIASYKDNNVLRISFVEPRMVNGKQRPGEAWISFSETDEALFFQYATAGQQEWGAVYQGEDEEEVGTAKLHLVSPRRLEMQVQLEGQARQFFNWKGGAMLGGGRVLEPSTVWGRWVAPVVLVMLLFVGAKVALRLLSSAVASAASKQKTE